MMLDTDDVRATTTARWTPPSQGRTFLASGNGVDLCANLPAS